MQLILAKDVRGYVASGFVAGASVHVVSSWLNPAGSWMTELRSGEGIVITVPSSDLVAAGERAQFRATREEWIEVAGKDAHDFAEQALSIGREFLPLAAIAVLDGEDATEAYWGWLVHQFQLASRGG